ncbi:MAG TPA: hypothetical protein VM487_18420 [Phycisphaerae bacterium]|nr:hypothetical protein [Phycisphaerae bacterium]
MTTIDAATLSYHAAYHLGKPVTCLGWPISNVFCGEDYLGWVSRTGEAGRLWTNSLDDRTYYATRKAAAEALRC